VAQDGWVFDGEPRFMDPTKDSEPYHKIYDAQGLGPDRALVLHKNAIFVLPRGQPPLASDEGLVHLAVDDLPAFEHTDWAFSSFAILPGSDANGARRVVAASYTNDSSPQFTRISWLDVTVDPPAIQPVATATTAGAAIFVSALTDVNGRAIFLVRGEYDGGTPSNERKVLLIAGREPPLHRIAAARGEVFGAVGVSPLPDAPHLVAFEDGRLVVTDLLGSESPRFQSQIPLAIGRDPAAMDAILEPDGLRVLIAGELGDYLWFDAERDRWTEPRLVADDETLRARGCVASASDAKCGYSSAAVELRDAFIHRDPDGVLWSLQIPQVCPGVLTMNVLGALTSIPVLDQPRSERSLERLRPGFSERHKLVSTDLGELFELELE
jgi:hypothetical protein